MKRARRLATATSGRDWTKLVKRASARLLDHALLLLPHIPASLSRSDPHPLGHVLICFRWQGTTVLITTRCVLDIAYNGVGLARGRRLHLRQAYGALEGPIRQFHGDLTLQRNVE